jgi:hypothetical protein
LETVPFISLNPPSIFRICRFRLDFRRKIGYTDIEAQNPFELISLESEVPMPKRFLCALLAMLTLLSACGKKPGAKAPETEPAEQSGTAPASNEKEQEDAGKGTDNAMGMDINTETNEDTAGRRLIVKDKRTASVRIRTGDSAAEKYAGKELTKYLEKIGIPMGDGLPIDVRIDPTLPDEGYAIHPDTDGIAIRGGDEHGVIYGVYGFLTHYAGVRFYTPELEVLGEGDILVNEDYELYPVFVHRRCDWEMFRYDTDWCLKNGVNNPAHGNIPEELGGTFDVQSMSLQSMTGVASSEQPCFSDPEVLAKVVSCVRSYLAEHPDTRIVNVSQLDNDNYCTCAKCTAANREEGSPSGSIVRFINAVAADIAADYPDVLVETFAYWYSRKPPKVTKPVPNVCIRLCTDDCCWSHALNDPDCEKNASFVKELLGWTAICDNVYIWDYTVNFGYYIPPFPNLDVLWNNMHFFAENGIRGMYPEGNHNSDRYGEFGELRAYLLAQLMMDPLMAEEAYYALMDGFLEAFYGEGWQSIRSFIDWTCAAANAVHMGDYDPPFRIIPEDTYLEMEETIDGWWDEAEAKAGDRRDFVQRSRSQWTYIKLMLRPDPEKGAEFLEYVKTEMLRWNQANADWSRFPAELEASMPSAPYAYDFRTHGTEPTPDGEASLVSLIGADRVAAYRPFDENVESSAGKVRTRKAGKLSYTDGYFGQAAQFDDGYVALRGWEPAKNSFSVALWMKTEGTGGPEVDPCILSNKDWAGGTNIGFVFTLRGRDVKFNVGVGGPARLDAEYPLPLDYADGWVYVVLVVDREAGVIRLSYDFEKFETVAIPEELLDTSLNTGYGVNIGQDGTGQYALHLPAILDEFLIVDGILTDQDVAALKAHYVG